MSLRLGGSGTDAHGARPFASFWLAGFDGADHIDLLGQTIDRVATTAMPGIWKATTGAPQTWG